VKAEVLKNLLIGPYVVPYDMKCVENGETNVLILDS
jgi:hypothetical protein